MLLKRLLCGVLAAVIVAAGGYYGWTYRFFDRPLSAQAQEEFEQQVDLPINFTLAASADSFEAAKNSMQAVREGVQGSSYALELNIAFDKKNVPYLADGADYITDSSVTLEKVFKSYAKYAYLRFILHITEFCDPVRMTELVREYSLHDRVLLTGFTREDMKKHAPNYRMFRLCMTVDGEDLDLHDTEVCKKLVNESRNLGANGLLCSAQIVTKELCSAVAAVGQFRILVNNADSTYDMYYAMSLNPNVIITNNPEELYRLMLSGDYLNVEQYSGF